MNGVWEIRVYLGGVVESMWWVCGKSSVFYFVVLVSLLILVNLLSLNGL